MPKLQRYERTEIKSFYSNAPAQQMPPANNTLVAFNIFFKKAKRQANIETELFQTDRKAGLWRP